MKKSCLKTTVIAAFLMAGSLMSACAISDGYTEKKTPPRPNRLTDGVLELTPQAANDLRFSDSKLAVVFAVDKEGKVQAFARSGSKFKPLAFPLHAENIIRMDTVTTFRTSNPTTCWLMGGSNLCISW